MKTFEQLTDGQQAEVVKEIMTEVINEMVDNEIIEAIEIINPPEGSLVIGGTTKTELRRFILHHNSMIMNQTLRLAKSQRYLIDAEGHVLV